MKFTKKIFFALLISLKKEAVKSDNLKWSLKPYFKHYADSDFINTLNQYFFLSHDTRYYEYKFCLYLSSHHNLAHGISNITCLVLKLTVIYLHLNLEPSCNLTFIQISMS